MTRCWHSRQAHYPTGRMLPCANCERRYFHTGLRFGWYDPPPLSRLQPLAADAVCRTTIYQREAGPRFARWVEVEP